MLSGAALHFYSSSVHIKQIANLYLVSTAFQFPTNTHVAKSYSLWTPFSHWGLTKESASDSSIDSNEYSAGSRSPEAITGRDLFRRIDPDEVDCGSEGFLNLSLSFNGIL